MKKRIVLAILLALLGHRAWAECPPHEFTDPARVRLASDAVLIVTHATSVHDARFAAKRGVDEAVHWAKRRRIPVVYLQDDSPEEFYFMADCRPDYWVFSESGEVRFDLPTHVLVAGGHLELCLSTTVHDVLRVWAKQPQQRLTLTYLLDAIYSNGKSVDESAPYYADFQRFMGIVTYGRPGGEHWQKVTLLETMGVIRKGEDELDYLVNILPHYARTLSPDYRIELALNDAVARVLRSGRGWQAPTLRFNFVDSAINLYQFLDAVAE